MPAELRPLFDLVWDDLSGEGEIDGDGPDSTAVAMAMSEMTGVTVTAVDVEDVSEATYYEAPSQVYADSLED